MVVIERLTAHDIRWRTIVAEIIFDTS